MSLDINWSLLSSPNASSSSSRTNGYTGYASSPEPNFSANATSELTAKLIASLNRTLSTTSRPSFIGPISITQFDFGDSGPEVDIRDIRDVWRSFDEAEGEDPSESEGEDEDMSEDGDRDRDRGHGEELGGYHDEYDHDYYDDGSGGPDGNHSGAYGNGQVVERTRRPFGHMNGHGHGHSFAYETESGYNYPNDSALELDHDDSASVFSAAAAGGISRRTSASIAAVGLGPGVLSPSLSLSLGLRGSFSPTGTGSIFSHPLSPGPTSGMGIGMGFPKRSISSAPLALRPPPHYRPDRSSRPAYNHGRRRSSPRRPNGRGTRSPKNENNPNPIPSIQLHLRLAHTSNLSLTLLTSLIVNYPSATFMSLPLKLVVTGLELHADIVLAYVGERHRAHLTIVDVDDRDGQEGYPYFKPEPEPPHNSSTADDGSQERGMSGVGYGHPDGHNRNRNANMDIGNEYNPHPPPYTHIRHMDNPPVDIGHKILPNLHIETEIGHADVHVLRNVGKVERFIADVVRKMLVDELVWPNFYTVAM